MADLFYDNKCYYKPKKSKPIANGNAADSSMIALTDKRLSCWKPKKEWKFKCKSW